MSIFICGKERLKCLYKTKALVILNLRKAKIPALRKKKKKCFRRLLKDASVKSEIMFEVRGGTKTPDLFSSGQFSGQSMEAPADSPSKL